MAIYLIVIPEDDDALPSSAITEEGAFENTYQILAGRVWLVKTPLSSCSEVAQKLNLGEPPSDRVAVVFDVDDANGYYLKSFWDALRAMGS